MLTFEFVCTLITSRIAGELTDVFGTVAGADQKIDMDGMLAAAAKMSAMLSTGNHEVALAEVCES